MPGTRDDKMQWVILDGFLDQEGDISGKTGETPIRSVNSLGNTAAMLISWI